MATSVHEAEAQLKAAAAVLEAAREQEARLAAIPRSDSEALASAVAALDRASVTERRNPHDQSTEVAALMEAVRVIIGYIRDKVTAEAKAEAAAIAAQEPSGSDVETGVTHHA